MHLGQAHGTKFDSTLELRYMTVNALNSLTHFPYLRLLSIWSYRHDTNFSVRKNNNWFRISSTNTTGTSKLIVPKIPTGTVTGVAFARLTTALYSSMRRRDKGLDCSLNIMFCEALLTFRRTSVHNPNTITTRPWGVAPTIWPLRVLRSNPLSLCPSAPPTRWSSEMVPL